MSDEAIERVRFYPGQFLRAEDLADDQRYHLDRSRRHHVGHHSFGIVRGLRLQLEEDGLFLTPGLGVDGYGRELVVPRRLPLDVPGAFLERGTDVLDVWLVYTLERAEGAPEGYATCATGDTAYRVRESPRLRYAAPDPEDTDRRSPRTVPAADRDFGPHRTPPDDPIEDWPLFLGQVRRAADGSYTIDDDDRPYAGLVGEEIVAASGRAKVQVGAERDDDPYRFGVRVRGVAPEDVPRLGVLRTGDVVLVGETSFLGNVTVGGALELESAPARTAPRPWSLYHEEAADGSHELHMELPSSTTASVQHEVVVGAWRAVTLPDGSEEERFAPCLTVAEDGTVTVHGNLVVEGTLIAGDRLPVTLSSEAYALMNAAFLSGVAGASDLVDEFYGGRIG